MDLAAAHMTLTELRGWLDDARHGRLQSVSVGFYTWGWREELWGKPWRVDHHKGMLTVTVGPVFVEFGG